MDKLVYHLNKKKQPAKTEGKYLYYYPCKKGAPDIHIGDKGYVVIEVTETEWEALFELDRFEYNNTHKFQRHTVIVVDRDENFLTPKEEEKRIDKGIHFTHTLNDQVDKERLISKLTKKEQEIYLSCIEDEIPQAQVAGELGVTQGYISAVLKKIETKLFTYEMKCRTPNDVVWKCWNMFVRKGEMPMFIDVEIEFVLRALFGDLMPFLHWFYSVGELCRFILRYYLFDEDKIDADIARYLQIADEPARKHFEDRYGDELPIIQGVYVRLCLEIKRRKNAGLHNTNKAVVGIFVAIDKLAKKLNTTPEEFMTQRFYPFIAEWRNRRIRQFYKEYTGKNLPQ
ncbi:MAG: hypothetical protein K2O04_05035 [Clostridiales bacterium]|nr:hypothetical protein [Clostridiales bacterium]